MEIENISAFQLWKIGKEPRVAHAGVSCQYAMGAGSANRQGCFWQVPDALTEHTGRYAMIDRQQDIDLWNFNVAHDSFGGEVQQRGILVILCEFCFKGVIQRHGFRQLIVVVLGTF